MLGPQLPRGNEMTGITEDTWRVPFRIAKPIRADPRAAFALIFFLAFKLFRRDSAIFYYC